MSDLKRCECDDIRNSVCRVNGCFFGEIPLDGDKIKPFIGKFVCFHCGGVLPPERVGDNWDSVTATCVLGRLKQLGVV